ncbi:hypothetical protein SmJEL517_g01221 [Synchytrium microbalum]|uniref:Homeobox domain-containing protein n=1 Tax=Synchytrium microbalum TaxID=1806994 RepID=A0A507CC02_9FUNG|nr:uncharacterized protein SmJEL517_g01221 [Synchytrium microbalum]TPX36699.1 hypothetical protein SmJEL517_g01221 [Synchytrium microbalum]
MMTITPYSPRSVSQATSLKRKALLLDVNLRQTQSPTMSPSLSSQESSPAIPYSNYMQGFPNLSHVPPESVSQWFDDLEDGDNIVKQLSRTSDFEKIPVTRCCCQQRSDLPRRENSIATPVSLHTGQNRIALPSRESSVGAPVSPLNGDTMNTEANRAAITTNKPHDYDDVMSIDEESVSSDSFHQPSTPTNPLKKRRYLTAGSGRVTKPSVEVFIKVFEQTSYPDTNVRKMLAERMNMTPRAVQIWFQNRRQHAKAYGFREGLLSKKRPHSYKAPTGPNDVAERLLLDVAMWCDEAGF